MVTSLIISPDFITSSAKSSKILYSITAFFLSLCLTASLYLEFCSSSALSIFFITISLSSVAISIVAIVFSIFTVLWSLILKFVVEYVSGKNALVLGDSAYFVNTFTDIINSYLEMGTTVLYAFSDLSIRRFIMDILGQLLTLFAFSSIGFLLGSILYRLKKKTSIIIFLIIPTIVITLGVAFYIFNTDLIMNYIVINLVDILRFIINVNIRLIIKLLTIVISLTCSVLLLKNAPIKEYAHDLI